MISHTRVIVLASAIVAEYKVNGGQLPVETILGKYKQTTDKPSGLTEEDILRVKARIKVIASTIPVE